MNYQNKMISNTHPAINAITRHIRYGMSFLFIFPSPPTLFGIDNLNPCLENMCL